MSKHHKSTINLWTSKTAANFEIEMTQNPFV